MISIQRANESHIPVIQEIAEKTWWPTYGPIVSEEQLRYMLDTIYSADALKKVINEGSQTFIVLADDGVIVGFASYGLKKDQPGVTKLHKLYVLPGTHGKGYGKAMLEEIKTRVKVQNQTGSNTLKLELNVNRYNPAKSFYEKVGFKIVREEDVPIGPYWMNDFVMSMDVL